jgi:molybdate transport system ATP-binding protein
VRLDARVRVPDRDVDVSLSVRSRRTLALVGPNGAGKSTVVAAIAGLLEGAQVTLDGRSLDALPPERRRVGVVFQDHLLFPHLTVLENVAFGPKAQRLPDPTGRAAAQLERLGLPELAGRRPGQLSGGQAQRVALARALAADPLVLLLDEPLAALDVEVRDDVRAELARHLADFQGVTIVVTHEIDDVAALAAEVAVVEGGSVTQTGTLDELRAAPATAYVRRLAG